MHKKVLQSLEQTLPDNQHTLILKNFIIEKEKTLSDNGATKK
jgi:hypothetical protein